MNNQCFPAIGIEIHIQLATKSKMFCGCNNESRDAQPNVNICPICMAMPGTLPVVNHAAIEMAIRFGLAINAKIAESTKFDRKNYFYPDLPKGYQISQLDQPIVYDGSVEILVDGRFREIGIERAHLEEDAGKLVHPAGADYSLVDLNRAGTPLIEVVSRPDMRSAAEAKRYIQEIYNIATALKITDGDMEHGNFKFDLNISMSDKPDKLGTKVELKNLNSFRNAERALNYEINRQADVLAKGNQVEQETRGWDDAKAVTFTQRGKEEAFDYRYFPEPDLPPLVIGAKMVDQLKKNLPTLPIVIRRELFELGLSVDEQDILIGQPQAAEIFNEAYNILGKDKAKAAVNWLVGDYQAWLSENNTVKSKLTGENLAKLVQLVDSGEISSKMAKDIFPDVVAGLSPVELIKEKNLAQISDEGELEGIIKDVIEKNSKAADDYRSGNQKAIGFLVGAVMRKTKGQANPGKVNQILLRYLQK